MRRARGQVGAKPPGVKQDAMDATHVKSVKAKGVVNTNGGSHPAARRALSPAASAKAASNSLRSEYTPHGRNYDTGINQDQALSADNAIDQDAVPESMGSI